MLKYNYCSSKISSFKIELFTFKNELFLNYYFLLIDATYGMLITSLGVSAEPWLLNPDSRHWLMLGTLNWLVGLKSLVEFLWFISPLDGSAGLDAILCTVCTARAKISGFWSETVRLTWLLSSAVLKLAKLSLPRVSWSISKTGKKSTSFWQFWFSYYEICNLSGSI